MFETLEATRLAIWVSESLWGYPAMLGMHIVGLAIVVGLFSMLDLALLGLIEGISPAVFRQLFPLAWTGLGINVLSGCALFSSQATIFIASTPFLVKLACIASGVVLAVLIRRELDVPPDGGAAATRLRRYALASLTCWIAAICAGRLIAYL